MREGKYSVIIFSSDNGYSGGEKWLQKFVFIRLLRSSHTEHLKSKKGVIL
jgi:hypothetical protein